MKLQIISIGNKADKPVEAVVDDYLSRLPKSFLQCEISDIKLAKRGASIPYQRAVDDETKRLLDKVPSENKLIILDRQGSMLSTEKLASNIEAWQFDRQNISIAIGGPEGFSQQTINEKADEVWSLSKMTIAHPIVKILLAEQLYRAYAILTNHPYHRNASFQN